MTEKAFMNLSEAAAYLGIGESTLRGEANKKGCPVIRRTPRGKMYFDKVDLVKWWKQTSAA